MASSIYVYNYDGTTSFRVSKWKIRVGSQLFYNSTILSCKQEGSKVDLKEPLLKYRSNVGGTVTELLVSEGDTVPPGAAILKVQPCTHPVIIKDLCAECGTDLRSLDKDNFEKLTAATTFSMVHVVPELKVSLEQAEKLGQDDEDRLLKNKKLVLLVDLDQTLIHTTNENVPEDMPGVFHFQLYGNNSPWYHTKLRPGTKSFLENIAKYYELHICTFGARMYAHKIAKVLDPDGKFFSHRILSRDECFDATSKTANLTALFPRGDHMVCIIDDREDVWNFAPNVIHVKPYTYFQNTGDINAPGAQPPTEVEKSNSNNINYASTVENGKYVDCGESKSNDPLPNESSSDKSPSETLCTNSDKKSSDSELTSEKSEQQSGKEILNTNSKIESQDNKSKVKSDRNDGKGYSDNTDETKSNGPVVNEVLQEVKCTDSLNVINKISDGNLNEENNKTSTLVEANKVSENCLGNGKKCEAVVVVGVTSTEKEKKENFIEEFSEGDDYLLHLEEILIKVHKAYYDLYNKGKKKNKLIPDLKTVVPQVRKKVLKNVNIVFSSAIPQNYNPEDHHFWTIAESLGASVTKEMVVNSPGKNTTHMIAVKPGTAKVQSARCHKIWIVTLNWLLCCDERWEHVDERLFPLPKDAVIETEDIEKLVPKYRRQTKRTHTSEKKLSKAEEEEEKFSERVFSEAGLALSQDEIEDMDREIEEACSEESEEENQNASVSSDSSSSAESLSAGDYPKGWKKRRKCDLIEAEMLRDIAEDSTDVETIGSVDEEMAEAVKQEFQNL